VIWYVLAVEVVVEPAMLPNPISLGKIDSLGVGYLQSGREPSREWCAGSIEGSLGNWMASREEVEGDGVACYNSRYVVGGIGEAVLSYVYGEVGGMGGTE
jgi:hypothetical protein